MTSIKIKFRKSKISDKRGTCFIQLINKRKMKTIATGVRLQTNEWDAAKEHVILSKSSPERCKELLLIQEELEGIVERLKEIIARLSASQAYVSADIIVQGYRELGFSKSYFSILEGRIRELEKNIQERTAINYKSALKVFQKFRNDKDIVPDEINGILIKEFEQYLKSRGNSLNTVSFYMRILQAAYNYAVEKKWVTQDLSPFKGVFTGEEKTVKRAVDMEVVMKLKDLNLSRRPVLDLAKDIFMFSLYTRGMTFIDIAHLKKENLKGDILDYKRHKTKQRIQIGLPGCAMEIIRKYALLMDETDFLFPVLYHPGRKKYCAYSSALRSYNDRLKVISQVMGLDKTLTSYVSRHTWATLAKTLGISIYIISDAMGHTSEETTRIYLDSINNNVLDQANNMVVSAILK